LAGALYSPEEKVVLTVDQPFLFAIVDKPTGVILFLGKVINPVL
jgi:serine protease inhibitor